MDFAFKSCTPKQRQVLLLALTFVIVVIIVLTCPDLATAIIIISALLGFYAAYEAAGRDRFVSNWASHHPPVPVRCEGGICPVKEGFNPLPGAPAPYAVTAAPGARPRNPGRYPGAVDIDEYDTEADYGHRDRTEGDGDRAPVGNPYNRGRISAPPAADACIDDEANDAEMDGDELMSFHGYARNDPERVTAGTMNRRRDLDKYLREEVTESEDREWWGRHEY